MRAFNGSWLPFPGVVAADALHSVELRNVDPPRRLDGSCERVPWLSVGVWPGRWKLQERLWSRPAVSWRTVPPAR